MRREENCNPRAESTFTFCHARGRYVRRVSDREGRAILMLGKPAGAWTAHGNNSHMTVIVLRHLSYEGRMRDYPSSSLSSYDRQTALHIPTFGALVKESVHPHPATMEMQENRYLLRELCLTNSSFCSCSRIARPHHGW